jgi:hypothetical protein
VNLFVFEEFISVGRGIVVVFLLRELKKVEGRLLREVELKLQRNRWEVRLERIVLERHSKGLLDSNLVKPKHLKFWSRKVKNRINSNKS